VTRIKEEATKEQHAYDHQMGVCKDGSREKGKTLAVAASEMENLKASIEKAKSIIATTTSKVEELATSLSQNEADLKAATSIRKKEQREFFAARKELTDTLDVLYRATNVLQRKLVGSTLAQTVVNNQDVKRTVTTLSTLLDAARLSVHDKGVLLNLAQGNATTSADDVGFEALEDEAPRKDQSDSILDVIDNLRNKAETQISELEKQELQSAGNFAILKHSLEVDGSEFNEEMKDTKSRKAYAQEKKATAEGNLIQISKSAKEIEAALDAMNRYCARGQKDHEIEMKTRKHDLDAIEAAIKILSQISSTGGDISFLQVNDSHKHLSNGSRLKTSADLRSIEVVHLLRRLARKVQSIAIAQLASEVASAEHVKAHDGADPFSRARLLIRDLIQQLEKEMNKDRSRKQWCDSQLEQTVPKKEDLQQSNQEAAARLDKAKSESVVLKEEIAELQTEIARLEKLQKTMNDVRAEQHDGYSTAKAELEKDIRGVREAVRLLRGYYSADDTKSGKQTGDFERVMGSLEDVETDLEKYLAEIETREDTAVDDYSKLSMENKMSRNAYEKESRQKEKASASYDKAVLDLTSDLDAGHNELDSVNKYLRTIRGACQLQPESWDERKVRREAEVAGLKKALEMLSTEELLQQKQGGLRGSMTDKGAIRLHK